jgi:lysozyme family protein
MTSKTKRLLFLAVTAMALVLATAPVSFAGESGSPGPTQVAETTVPVVTTQAPAETPAPAAAPAPAPAAAAPAAEVKAAVKTVIKKDTVRAKGGIQAGFGGMATQSSSLPMTLAFTAGILLLLGAAAGFSPLRRNSQD